jgi:hypothetical protein
MIHGREPVATLGAIFMARPRSNDTHASTTDPDARLYRKSKERPARLCHMGHLLIENRHVLIVDTPSRLSDLTRRGIVW